MEVKDLNKEQILAELNDVKQTLVKLRRQRSGLDNEIDHYYVRKNELEDEIIRRYEGDN